MMARELTDRQMEVLRLIRGMEGKITFRRVQEALDIKNVGGVSSHITNLIKKGYDTIYKRVNGAHSPEEALSIFMNPKSHKGFFNKRPIVEFDEILYVHESAEGGREIRHIARGLV